MQLAESIGKGLARAAIVAKVDGKQVDLSYALNGSSSVQILTEKDPEALKVLRHSAAHVMAEAITRIWPDVKLAYGPPTENGFFYDVALDAPISSDDFQRIEGLMAEIVNQNRPFTRYELRASEALPKLKDEGNQYKSDNANRAIYEALGDPNPGQTVDLQMKLKHLDPFQFSDGVLEKLNKASLDPTLSFYVTGDNATIGTNPNATGRVLPRHAFWEDLCKGPHVPTTGKIRAFKVMSVSQSHWHGDINKDRFQRVYGTAFFENKQLEEYLRMLEEAKKRDHRVLGKQLGLFTISPLVGSGLILWMPKGAVLRYQLESFLREELTRRGYQEVYTPHIGNIELYKRSGHYPYYKESQFPPIHMAERTAPVAGHAADTDEFLLRPMNCPHHIQIFAAEPKSYRDLPVRLAEFGTVYRYEESGELSGLTRVRGFTQDDAHIFCTPEQVEAEFRSTVELVQFVFKSLHFADVEVRLSLRDPASAKWRPRERRRFTGPRSISWSATCSAANGNWGRCNSIMSCRSVLSWNTSGRMGRSIARS
jgi:threonyl-tRNA synthetase